MGTAGFTPPGSCDDGRGRGGVPSKTTRQMFSVAAVLALVGAPFARAQAQGVSGAGPIFTHPSGGQAPHGGVLAPSTVLVERV